ncbi:hypothetical protein EV421DRAFT_1745334 [Armillaria borealis]|uniref:Protein kinase domain-containing protein n=1 Tax=Armillaria borealis TaxID=47425 RepID=A0AA39IUU8_9AGAR|nr:hypothetical protein EV421DRAFT_1745334 [Armillaria borealis]
MAGAPAFHTRTNLYSLSWYHVDTAVSNMPKLADAFKQIPQCKFQRIHHVPTSATSSLSQDTCQSILLASPRAASSSNENQKCVFDTYTSSSATTTISAGYTNGDWMTKFFILVKKKGVETAMVSLESVKAAAGVISVPALGPAAEILYSVLEKVYQSQQNAGTAREIADLCLRAHSTLVQHLQNMEITPALSDGIQQFEADLRNAQEIADNRPYTPDVLLPYQLFQIKDLLLLNEISVKIHASVQRVEQTAVGMNATLQRIEQTTVVLMNRSEPAPRSKGASIISRSEFTPCEVITDGPGYSLQTAEMHGKAVAIRVITGCKAKSVWEEAVKLESKVLHPNLPHLIGTSSSDEGGPLFSVNDQLIKYTDIKDPLEGVILSWMSQDVDEIMYMCSRMIYGISSALNNLSEQARLFDMGAKGFDTLWDARSRVVLVIHPEVASSSSSTALVSPDDHTSRLLRVMDDICANVGIPIFDSVNHIRYGDELGCTTSRIIPVDEDTSPTASTSPPSNIALRWELIWEQAADSGTDLRKISQQYRSIVCPDRSSRQPVPRFRAIDESTPVHRCNGYQREELTLTHSILDNNVVNWRDAIAIGTTCETIQGVVFDVM